MRYQSSGTCTYLPSHVSYLYEQKRNAMRQSAFARARAAPKRKLRSDESNDEWKQPTTVEARIAVDEFGNRVVVDRLKRLRVSSPPASAPASPPLATPEEDIAMDEEGESITAIVPTARSTLAPTVSPAAKKFVSASMASTLSTDPACRAIIVFDPLASIGSMPRIEFPDEDEDEDEDEKESDSDWKSAEHFVRFEELPDDYEEEAEAMEVD